MGRPHDYNGNWYKTINVWNILLNVMWHFVFHAECLKLEAVNVRAHLQ